MRNGKALVEIPEGLFSCATVYCREVNGGSVQLGDFSQVGLLG